jgi:hypothetical protein
MALIRVLSLDDRISLTLISCCYRCASRVDSAVLRQSLKEQRDLVKRSLLRAKANRYFIRMRAVAVSLGKYSNVDLETALETYRIARPAFTTDGIPTHDERTEYLKEMPRSLALRRPCPATRVFDFPYSAK